MKNIRIHIWFLVNVAIVSLVYFYPSLVKLPVYLVLFLSGFLLRDKREINEDHTKKLPWYGIAFAALIPIGLVISAATGYTAELNSKTTDVHVKAISVILGIFICVAYYFLLSKSMKALNT